MVQLNSDTDRHSSVATGTKLHIGGPENTSLFPVKRKRFFLPSKRPHRLRDSIGLPFSCHWGGGGVGRGVWGGREGWDFSLILKRRRCESNPVILLGRVAKIRLLYFSR